MDERLKRLVDNWENIRIGADDTFQFHCTMCGKCCINRDDILLTPRDIFNISKELEITPRDFFRNYCETYIGEGSRIPIVRLQPRGSVKRCPLLKDRKCSVHKAKPTVCAMFPIGRALALNTEDAADITVTAAMTQYILDEPNCGDKSETHTVRQWLESFGIPVEDDFFAAWQQTVVRLSYTIRRAEDTVSHGLLEIVWTALLAALYLAYDTTQEFFPQFTRNATEIMALVDQLHVAKGAEEDEG